MYELEVFDDYLVSRETGEIFFEDGDIIRPAQLSDFLCGYQND